jgi:predicted GNAT superfamily acetyltransferase
MKKLEKIFAVKGKKFLFKVETSHTASDYLKYEELRNEIWGIPEDNLPGSRNMMSENFLHEGSSLFIAVYAEAAEGGFRQDKSHLVGFSYGFVGVKDKEIAFRALDNLWFYSQYTGVRSDFQKFGIGILIKEFQREKLLDAFGISNVTCTYDPLTGINAYRNIHHFGMEVLEYRESLYGEYGGHLNRLDIASDRFFVSWDLKKEIQRPEYHLESLLDSHFRVIKAENLKVQGKSRSLELEVIQEVNLNLDQEFLLVQIPFDFYLMLRETDVEDEKTRRIPLEWRMKTRQVFQNLFQRKYKIIDFRKSEGKDKKGFYVLWKE